MSGRAEVVAGITTALRDVLPPGADPVLTEDTRLFDDLALESVAVLELLMIVEDTMGITVDPKELDIDHLRSIRSFAEFVESRQAAAVRDGV